MARWTPVPVAGGAYSDDCLPWSSQDTVNYIPVKAEREGARSMAMLRCLPGCVTFSVTGSNAPVRGARNVEGKLFAVSGNALYRVGTDGTATSLGVIPGTSRISMAHNQIAGGNEVAIANGLSGYIYNTATETLAQITDEGFPGAKVFGFIDGYLMFVEPQGRFWGWSDLAAGTSYNTLDRSEAEAQPDRIVTGIETHGEWFVLGERSGEFYRNTGATTGTFQRIDGTTMEVGCAATHAAAKLDNSVFWLGSDGIVYRLNGYQPQRISTHAIEQAISRCNMAQAFATTFEDRGHKVFYLTFPDGKTWGFDVATGEWHRRRSDGLDRWRMNTLTHWNGAWIAGDYSNGRLYQLDWAVQHEAGAEMERRRIFPVMHDNQNRLTVNAVEFVFDTGLGEQSDPLPTPILAPLRISGDLPGGTVADSGTYQYTATGGALPRTFSITSGSLPAGATMNSAGLVTYDFSADGVYSWTVRVTDADGVVAHLADTATVASDAGFANVIALLHFNGADASTSFIDQKPNTWTASGNAHITTAQSVYGGASGEFDGNGDHIVTSAGLTNFALGEDFTLEFRVRLRDTKWQFIAGFGSNAGGVTPDLIASFNQPANPGKFQVAVHGSQLATLSAVNLNQWYAVAVVRSGGYVRIYVDGVLDSTASLINDAVNLSGANAYIGCKTAYAGATVALDGWLDELRLTKGLARYTANYTPATGEFPNG